MSMTPFPKIRLVSTYYLLRTLIHRASDLVEIHAEILGCAANTNQLIMQLGISCCTTVTMSIRQTKYRVSGASLVSTLAHIEVMNFLA